jgi:predicted amidohydrolase YtcJ
MRRDLFIHNARIETLVADASPARAMVVAGGRIQFVGAVEEARRYAHSGTEELDLGGRSVIPGLIDAHCHLLSYGLTRLRSAELLGVPSIPELQERLGAQRARLGIDGRDDRWLLGRGFDQELLAERRWPTRADLDAVSAEIPILISRVCGHAIVVNSAALRLAGASGAEGRFTETAMQPFWARVPDPTPEEWSQAAREATAEAARVGFTGVHCLLSSPAEVTALQALHRQGALPIRVVLQPPFAWIDHLRSLGIQTGFGDDRLRFGALKIFADGSMGARTAALSAPFTDDPGNCGELIFSPEEMDRRVAATGEAGFQVAVHAIGDRAVEIVLDAMERAPRLHARPRIEHASLLRADLVTRMVRRDVVAAVQPQFVVSDFWTIDRLGPERTRWAYPFRTMLQAGVAVAGSTDCPVERLDPWQAIARAVTRDEHTPQERLTPRKAVEIFTRGSAYASGDEPHLGSLEPGKHADFLVLDADPFTADPAALEAMRPVMTFVSGECVAKVQG